MAQKRAEFVVAELRESDGNVVNLEATVDCGSRMVCEGANSRTRDVESTNVLYTIISTRARSVYKHVSVYLIYTKNDQTKEYSTALLCFVKHYG